MKDEIEIKLELDGPADAGAVLSAIAGSQPRELRLEATYFDTADEDVRKAGFVVRIRREEGSLVETVKGSGSKVLGMFARAEWERPALGEHPVIDDTTPLRGILGERASALQPVFNVNVDRRVWRVRRGGAEIEIALDMGMVEAGAARTTVAEIELELKEGEPEALFATAGEIAARLPVRLGVMTKAGRGYGLRAGVPASFKSEGAELPREASAADGFRALGMACLTHYRLNEGLVLADPAQVEALHQARVALRRLRSAFHAFRGFAGDGQARALMERVRMLAAVYGDVRDLDVFLKAHPGLEAASTARDAARRRLARELRSDGARALPLDIATFLADGDWHRAPELQEQRATPIKEHAADALDRLRRRVKKRGRRFAKIGDEERHELRKATKKLRYAAEFFESLFSRNGQMRRKKRFLAALEKLQDRLGEFNDMVAGGELQQRFGLDPAAGGKAQLARLIDAAEAAYDALIDQKKFWK